MEGLYQILGYKHCVMKHNVGEYVGGAVHTNGMEPFWLLLRRDYIETYNHISAKHLLFCVSEFDERHSTRLMERFGHFVRLTVDKRRTYEELINATN